MTLMVVQGKAYFRELAERIVELLRYGDLRKMLRLHDRPLEWPTDTGGWCYSLGRIIGQHYEIVLFNDRFTLHGQPKSYYGIFTNKKQGILKAERLCQKELGRPIIIGREESIPSGHALRRQ
jgi:hypothetical protein